MAFATLAISCSGCSIPTQSEADAIEAETENVSSVIQGLQVADSFIKFDPALDVTQSFDWNAAAVKETIVANTSGCSGVTTTTQDTTVTTVFAGGDTNSCLVSTSGIPIGVALDGGSSGAAALNGTPPTVYPAYGVKLATGTIRAAVQSFSPPPSMTTPLGGTQLTLAAPTAPLGIAINLENLKTSSGETINGVLALGTSDSKVYNVTGIVINNGAPPGTSSATNVDLKITAAPGSFTINGSSTTERYAANSTNGSDGPSVTYENVTKLEHDCYPSSGTLIIEHGDVKTVAKFDKSTATTGKLSATGTGYLGTPVGDIKLKSDEQTVSLPKYGDCPGPGTGPAAAVVTARKVGTEVTISWAAPRPLDRVRTALVVWYDTDGSTNYASLPGATLSFKIKAEAGVTIHGTVFLQNAFGLSNMSNVVQL